MDAKTSNMTISENMKPYIYTMVDGESIEDKANIFMIIGMFAAQTISLEKAAELMGKSVWDFIEILKKYHIPWGEYTEESKQMDDIALMKLAGGIYV